MTVYSPSRLNTFENCPRQFEYRYIQKLERTRESIEAYVGKRVHEILERLYHHVARHRRPPSLRQILDRYESDWRLRWHDEVEIIREGTSEDDYRERGVRCLENYYRRHYPFDDGETVAIEHPVHFQLDGDGRYRARGILDRLVRRGPGHYEIHDYKTGSWLPPQSQLDSDRQLAMYQIGVQQAYPDAREVDLVWHYLSFDRTLRSRRSEPELRTLSEATIGLIDTIETTRVFPAKPSALCRWCEYRDLCPDARLPVGAPSAELDPPPLGLEPRDSGAESTGGIGPPEADPPLPSGTQLSLL
ncbi:MAG: RecB family exonuclease [Myxococcota bacterium]